MFLLPNKSGTQPFANVFMKLLLFWFAASLPSPCLYIQKNVGAQATLASFEGSLVQKRFFNNLRQALTPWIVNSLEVALTFIFLSLCLWRTPGAFTFSFKNCASFFQSQKFHTKPCEIKDFKNRLWLVPIMNTERDGSPEGSHSLLQN